MSDANEGQSPVIDEDDDGMDDLLIDAGLPPEEKEAPDSGGESDEQPKADDEKPAENADTGTPPTDEKPVEDEPGTEHEEEQDDPKSEETEEITFKYKEKVYSLEDLKNDDKLRERILTGANQQTHYQKIYDEQKQQATALQQQIDELKSKQVAEQQHQQIQQDQSNQPVVTPDQLTAAYDPKVKQMVQEGWIDEDMASLYPNAVAGMVSIRDEMSAKLSQLENALGRVISNQQTNQRSSFQQTVQGRFDNIFDQLASEGGIFEPLSSQETRSEFLTKVGNELNPELETITADPSVLRNLWIAGNHDRLVEATEAKFKAQMREEENKKIASQTRLAAGEGGGNSSSPTIDSGNKPLPGEQEGWADL